MTKLAISVAEFCHLVGIGRTKTFELINDGTLATLKIGRRTLIKMSSVESLLRRGDIGFAEKTPCNQGRRDNATM